MTSTSHPGFDETELWPQKPGDAQPQYEVDQLATAAARDWLQRHSRKRSLLWLHLIRPHNSYTPDPQQTRRYATGYEGDLIASRSALGTIHRTRRQIGPAELAHLVSLYDEKMTHADLHGGEVLDAVEVAGGLDQTLTVGLRDHGEERYDHASYFLYSLSSSRSVLHVPFVMRLPGVLAPGRVVPQLLQHADVAPTLLSLLGLPIPEEMEGVDLESDPGKNKNVADKYPAVDERLHE